MKVAVCYRNVGITTVTFLASANESLAMSIPSHSGLFKFMNILMYLLVCGIFVHTEWRTAQSKLEMIDRKLH